MAKRIAVLVSNDLNHDQRVLKTCATLEAEGWTPVLIGRQMPESKPLNVPFEARRLQLPFRRGVGFYAALQIGLLRALFRTDINAIWANDLDTLLPAFLVARAKRLPLVYDSHEYFTEAAGLTGRPLQRGVWLMVERAIFPRLKAVITVNKGIADASTSVTPTHEAVVPSSCATCLANAANPRHRQPTGRNASASRPMPRCSSCKAPTWTRTVAWCKQSTP